MKTTTLYGIMAALLSVPFVLSAQPGPPAGMDRPMHQRMMDDLKLTDQQQKEIDKLRSDAMKDQIDRRSQIAKARVELHDLMKAENPSQTAIEKKMNDIGSLQNQAQAKRLGVWFSVNKLLNPEQQKMWKGTLSRHAMMGTGPRMGRGMERMERMGRMGQDGMQRHMDRERRER